MSVFRCILALLVSLFELSLIVVSEKFPCPACGFLVFEEPVGSFDICAICGWEDDPVQLRFPSTPTGANSTSLIEWQNELSSEVRHAAQEHLGIRKDPRWYPLSSVNHQLEEPKDDKSYFDAAAEDPPGYYWRDES